MSSFFSAENYVYLRNRLDAQVSPVQLRQVMDRVFLERAYRAQHAWMAYDEIDTVTTADMNAEVLRRLSRPELLQPQPPSQPSPGVLYFRSNRKMPLRFPEI